VAARREIDPMSDTPPSPEEWSAWLYTFREQFIAAQGWTEKESKLCIRDAWAVVRDSRFHVLTGGDQRPEDDDESLPHRIGEVHISNGGRKDMSRGNGTEGRAQ
jgi:hypothetical protein